MLIISQLIWAMKTLWLIEYFAPLLIIQRQKLTKTFGMPICMTESSPLPSASRKGLFSRGGSKDTLNDTPVRTSGGWDREKEGGWGWEKGIDWEGGAGGEREGKKEWKERGQRTKAYNDSYLL